MNKISCITLGLTLPTLLMFGCNSEKPSSLKPAAVLTEIVAKANGTGDTVIEARLQVGPDDSDYKDLKIALPYTIVASVGGKQKTLSRVEEADDRYYKTSFNSDSIKDKYIVDVQDLKSSTSNTVIVLPEPFNITSDNNKNYGRDQDINITWDTVSKQGSMDAGFVLTCKGNEEGSAVLFVRSTKDDGRFTINAADIVGHPKVDVDTTDGCDAMVIMRRSIETKLDPRYGKGSYSMGVQERVVNFSIAGLTAL